MEANEMEKLKGKNWMAAMSLCWLFGAFGAHRFYTGKTNSAWAMAVMSVLGCTSLVSAAWALIDGVMLALGNFTHEDGSELYERVPWFGYLYIILVILGLVVGLLYVIFFFGVIAAAVSSGGATTSPVTP